MNPLYAIQGYCRSIAFSTNASSRTSLRDDRLSEAISVLENLPKTNTLYGLNLCELALVIARPDLKPAAIFPVWFKYDESDDEVTLERMYKKLQKMVLPIPFAIERVWFSPNKRWLDVRREFLRAEPIASNGRTVSLFQNHWSITNNSRIHFPLTYDLYYDINPYWKEIRRFEMRRDLGNLIPFEEFVIYVGTDKENLNNLLAARNIRASKEGDLKRAEVLAIPKEAAHEFCSLTLNEQIRECNRVTDGIERGILPNSLSSIWWWTTINSIGRREEIKLANEVENFYRQLKEASSPELLKWLTKE